jgi:hypothetical protein
MRDRPSSIGGEHPRPSRLAAWAPQLAAVCALVLLAPAAHAQPAPPPSKEPDAPKAGAKAKVFDFTGLDISGRLRTPQLLYFLDRANEELERASLERRSFIPEMVRSVDEGRL